MNYLKQKLELSLYGYEIGEFMPIFEDGKLANRNQYVAYKAGRVIHRLIKR